MAEVATHWCVDRQRRIYPDLGGLPDPPVVEGPSGRRYVVELEECPEGSGWHMRIVRKLVARD